MRNTRTFRAVSVAAGHAGHARRSLRSQRGQQLRWQQRWQQRHRGGSGGTAAPPKPAPGFDGTTIKLGVITPVTGSAAVIGNPLTAGNKVYFDGVNAKGGIAGKYKVELEVARHASTTADRRAAVQGEQGRRRHVRPDPGHGASSTPSSPQLDTDEIIAGPGLARRLLGPRAEPACRSVVRTRSRSINGMDYAVRNLDAKNKTICALTKDDPYGEAGLAGPRVRGRADGLQRSRRRPRSSRATPTSPPRSTSCRAPAARSSLFVGLPTETSPVLTGAAGRGVRPEVARASRRPGCSVFASPASDLAPYLQENFLLLSEGPQWGDTSVPGMSPDARRHRGLRAGPEAGHLLRLRLRPGAGRRPRSSSRPSPTAISARPGSSTRRRRSPS